MTDHSPAFMLRARASSSTLRRDMKPSFAFLAVCLLWLVAGCASVPTLTDPAQLDAFVGQKVRVVGTVSNTKTPEILGIEIDASSPDLRGQLAEAEGVLERTEVTQAEFDKMWRERGPFQSRGPGVFYRLRIPFSQETARAQRPNPAPVPTSGRSSPRSRLRQGKVGARVSP